MLQQAELSIVVAGHWIYLLYPAKSYVDALTTPITTLLVGGMLAFALGRRQ